jgi:hypothetical protein
VSTQERVGVPAEQRDQHGVRPLELQVEQVGVELDRAALLAKRHRRLEDPSVLAHVGRGRVPERHPAQRKPALAAGAHAQGPLRHHEVLQLRQPFGGDDLRPAPEGRHTARHRETDLGAAHQEPLIPLHGIE